ncbi:Dephospho-CoA kinase [Nitrosomonas aestuarii]|uniref:Dephospho-CoA kinase n=1 Tax=Nitrosomonas aestuarii TaxID=52441 RepID=A0A1I4C2N3_9PROT|nr:hypothetical protein [Nitrosomonas aestuarii]SFK75318.1 Dephospho-CoA kinase [Nitrosomonas aestuarii]
MKLIGLTGAAGCGKNTVADYLSNHHGYLQMSFAERLKASLSAMLDIPAYKFEHRTFKETVLPRIGKTPREMLQTLGTEYGRDMVNPDLWVILLHEKILKQADRDPNRSIVITDVRFENEASYIRSSGGTIWHIERPNNPHRISSNHESEKPVSRRDGDCMIMNDGTLEDLRGLLNDTSFIETELT